MVQQAYSFRNASNSLARKFASGIFILVATGLVGTCDAGEGTTAEIYYNGAWVNWCRTPHLCATAAGDYRFIHRLETPAFVSAFIICKNGMVVPISPWLDSKCTRRLESKHTNAVVITGSDINRSLIRNGLSSEGQLALIILSHVDFVPALRITELEKKEIWKRQTAITVPGFHFISNGVVRRSVALGEFFEGPLPQHQSLLEVYCRLNARVFAESKQITTILFGTLPASYTKGFRDSEILKFRKYLSGSIANYKKDDITAALADADQAVLLGQKLFSPPNYAIGHPELVQAIIHKGNMLFYTNKKAAALSQFAEAKAVSVAAKHNLPTFASNYYQLICDMNCAAICLEFGRPNEARENLSEAIQTAEQLIANGLCDDAVLRAYVGLQISQSTLLCDYVDGPTGECNKCLDEASRTATRIKDNYTRTLCEISIRNQAGVVQERMGDFGGAVREFERARLLLDGISSKLLPGELLEELGESLVNAHLVNGSYSAARDAALWYIRATERYRDRNPELRLRALLGSRWISIALLRVALGDEYHRQCNNALIGTLENCDFKSVDTLQLALRVCKELPRDDTVVHILDEVERTCRQLDGLSQSPYHAPLLFELLQLRAHRALLQHQRGYAELLANEAARELGARIDGLADPQIVVAEMIALAEVYNELGKAAKAESLIKRAYREYPNWHRDLRLDECKRIVLEHAFRRWREGQSVQWPLDELLYRDLDYGLMVHAAGDELESIDWCGKQRRVAAMLIEGVERGMVNVEGCYGFCSVRKGLASTGMWLRRAAGTNDSGTRLRAQLILEKRRQAAQATQWIFANQHQPPPSTPFGSGMPLDWSITLDESVKESGRQWLTTSTQTREKLRPDEALIDFFLAPTIVEDHGRLVESDAVYYAFVSHRDHPLTLVKLGTQDKTDEIVAAWRQAIAEGRDSPEADQLRQQIWDPIEQVLRDKPKRIFLCPDGRLSAISWGALPDKRPNSILLERYAFALVPYGSYLYDRRQPDAEEPAVDSRRMLLVGDVDYDAPIAPLAPLPAREPLKVRWPVLEYSDLEIEQIASLLDGQPSVTLSSQSATTDRVIQEMQTARWLHFATHSYFAAPVKLKSRLGRSEYFENNVPRRTLLYSGLVLAGANHGPYVTEQRVYDGGMLNGEVITNLALDQVEMAVLSGCDSGSGFQSYSGGTMGLQRAFHLAGAKNVVATLWHVEDRTTAALMKLFYYYCFAEKLAPVDALRQAQLDLRRQPQLVSQLTTLRGPDFTQAAQKLRKTPSNANENQLDARWWAGFILSGTGE